MDVWNTKVVAKALNFLTYAWHLQKVNALEYPVLLCPGGSLGLGLLVGLGLVPASRLVWFLGDGLVWGRRWVVLVGRVV